MSEGTDGLNGDFASRLDALIGASGGRIFIKSGYRSVEEQTKLWNAAVAKYGSEAAARKWVAYPGTSNHNKGLAADLGGDLALAHELAPRYGLTFPMDWEEWHIEPLDLEQDGRTTPPGVPNGATGGPSQQMQPKNTMVGALSLAAGFLGLSGSGIGATAGNPALAAHDSGVGDAKGFMAGVKRPDPAAPAGGDNPDAQGGGGPSSYGDDLEGWIRQAMAATGVPDEWFEPLMEIAKHESGGDPGSKNDWDSNAKAGTPSIGLMQTIGPTFDEHKMEGHDDIYNPVDNTIAAIRYIQSRYGDVTNVPGIKALANGNKYVGY